MKYIVLSTALAVSLLAVPATANTILSKSDTQETTLSDAQIKALSAVLGGLPRQ